MGWRSHTEASSPCIAPEAAGKDGGKAQKTRLGEWICLCKHPGPLPGVSPGISCCTVYRDMQRDMQLTWDRVGHDGCIHGKGHLHQALPNPAHARAVASTYPSEERNGWH